MRTTKNYEIEIKEKYDSDKKSSRLRGNLYKLTRSGIRQVCLNLVDEGLKDEDEIVIKNFFELKVDDDLRAKIKKYDIDGFRPICKFLKNETETIKQFDALELIALLIDFIPRPYSKYRNEALNPREEKNIEDQKTIADNVDIIYSMDPESGSIQITVPPKDKKLFAWFSNASAANKTLWLIGITAVLLVPIVMTIFFSNDESIWMVWDNDHYIETSFDADKVQNGTLKLYKEDRIENFRRIEPDSTYTFFNKNGSVRLWYGKNSQGDLEYFTDLGLHPETGKTLKPITQYMINKYIRKLIK